MIVVLFFFFNDTATTEIYTLSLHDALPICSGTSTTSSPNAAVPASARTPGASPRSSGGATRRAGASSQPTRSEEHTSELQSRQYLVCRLLLEKKNILHPSSYTPSSSSSSTH